MQSPINYCVIEYEEVHQGVTVMQGVFVIFIATDSKNMTICTQQQRMHTGGGVPKVFWNRIPGNDLPQQKNKEISRYLPFLQFSLKLIVEKTQLNHKKIFFNHT